MAQFVSTIQKKVASRDVFARVAFDVKVASDGFEFLLDPAAGAVPELFVRAADQGARVGWVRSGEPGLTVRCVELAHDATTTPNAVAFAACYGVLGALGIDDRLDLSGISLADGELTFNVDA